MSSDVNYVIAKLVRIEDFMYNVCTAFNPHILKDEALIEGNYSLQSCEARYTCVSLPTYILTKQLDQNLLKS